MQSIRKIKSKQNSSSQTRTHPHDILTRLSIHKDINPIHYREHNGISPQGLVSVNVNHINQSSDANNSNQNSSKSFNPYIPNVNKPRFTQRFKLINNNEFPNHHDNIFNYMKYISISDNSDDYTPKYDPHFNSVHDIFNAHKSIQSIQQHVTNPYTNFVNHHIDVSNDNNDDKETDLNDMKDIEDLEVDENDAYMNTGLCAIIDNNDIANDDNTQAVAPIRNLSKDLDGITNAVRCLKEENKILKQKDKDNQQVIRTISKLCKDLNQETNKLNDIQNDLNRIKKENKILKQKNNELINKLNVNQITKENILCQLIDSLLNLRNEINVSKLDEPYNYEKSNILYTNVKNKLQSIYELLNDLANDIDCDDLYIAAEKLQQSIQDVILLEQSKLYKYDDIMYIINNLLKGLNKKQTPDGSGTADEIEIKYPELLFDTTDTDNDNDIVIKKSNSFVGKLDNDYPMIIRIDIDGGYFNKKTRAIIKYKNQIFRRKMADFEWLINMLRSNCQNSSCIPNVPKEQPPLLWTINYLNQRKNELNLFLMHCHSLNNIKNSIPYNIFLEANKKCWKKKRNKFNKKLLMKIKHK